MEEPRHPAGPAFDLARESDEARRQRLIAALTPQQRESLKQQRQLHETQAKELVDKQRRGQREAIAERMRGRLLPNREPHLRHNAHRHSLKDRQDLASAVGDFVAGGQTRATQHYARELRLARDKAQRDVRREHEKARTLLKDTQQRERDDFLRRAERSREHAEEFGKAARDPSWQRAFSRAVQKEAGYEHVKERDPEKAR